MGSQELIAASLLIVIGLLPLTNPDWTWMLDKVISGILGSEEIGHGRANRITLQILGALSILFGIILIVESISRTLFAR